MKKREKSQEIFAASCRVIPGGVNSPVRAFTGLGMTPLVVTEGEGAVIRDIDGHAYIDYCCSWGALILGHAHPAVVQAATEQMARGSTFGIVTPYELQLAEKIRDHLPSIEKIRFVSSGTEAVMSAIRLARGCTGKDKIVKFMGHYHGHSDSLLSRSKGVPPDFVKHTISLPFNEIDVCRAYLRSSDDVAAVILEPIAGNMGLVPAARDFIAMLREETEKKRIILIFDEVITGFRVGLKGAQGFYNIQPDLTCLGKIIGGGFPAAAFGGRAGLMDQLAPLGEVYQAGTLSGNPVAMRAGLATLLELEKPGFYEKLEAKTLSLVEAFHTAVHLGSMFTPFFDSKFFNHLFQRGIYFAPSAYEINFVSSAHTDEQIELTREAILQFSP